MKISPHLNSFKMMESLLLASSPTIEMPLPHLNPQPSTKASTSSSSSSSSSSLPIQNCNNDVSTAPSAVAEFDGETVLCRVCGDKASGFHYGVHACEGCKGFFRRSIQQKIQYRPCLKNQQCNIQRVNRNRCQYCRLKKCIHVGMSRDAVRFGRVPKKEKARIIEQMQKQNSAAQSNELNSVLSNSLDIVQQVVNAHRHTCDVTQVRAHQMRDLALHNGDFVNCPAHMACPLNNEAGLDMDQANNGGRSHHANFSNFSESFTPAIKSVVDFAKGIPGFTLLNQDDQVTLLKAGTFEVLLVRLACLFDPNSNTMMFTKGKLFRRQPTTMATNAGFLLDSMFDFAERFNQMCLIDDEIAMFSAVVLMSPDRPGIRNLEQVERIQNKLTAALQGLVSANHTEDPTLFAKLVMKTTDLRTLNTLHSEKSIAGQRNNSEGDSDMDLQDSISTRSGRSSPAPSEASGVTMTSGYSADSDSSNIVMGQRLPLESSSHQQVVLRTPYGTFFREEMSGFYGMMPDQPRRRCNTLDRDTLSRPRLHTIEEGNKRRYTMDRDYMKQLANRLDHMDYRSGYRVDSMPASLSNSTTSSPIQEEAMYAAAAAAASGNKPPPPSLAAPNATFTSADLPQSTTSNRTSPLVPPGAGSSPASPKSRSRSGSLTQDDYAQMRPRCYSFHLNSEGRAARMPSIHRGVQPPVTVTAPERNMGPDKEMAPDGVGTNQYMAPEMRRGSIGTAYGLYSRKASLLVDRPVSYIARPPAPFKHLMPEAPPLYGLAGLTPDLSQPTQPPHPALWAHPLQVMAAQRQREEFARAIDWDAVNVANAAAAKKKNEASNLLHQQARDLSMSSSSLASSSSYSGTSLPSKSATATSTITSSTMSPPQSNEAAGGNNIKIEKDSMNLNYHNNHGESSSGYSSAGSSSDNRRSISAFISSVVKREQRDINATNTGIDLSDRYSSTSSMGAGIIPSSSSTSYDLPANDNNPSAIESMDVDNETGISSPTDQSGSVTSAEFEAKGHCSPVIGINNSGSKKSEQNSPEPEEVIAEKFGHKKFDKFRKIDKNNSVLISSSKNGLSTNNVDGAGCHGNKDGEKASSLSSSPLSFAAIGKEEEKSHDNDEEDMKVDEDVDNKKFIDDYNDDNDSDREGQLEIDDRKVNLGKDEPKSPLSNSSNPNNTINFIAVSPGNSERSSPSPNNSNNSGGERPKLSAKEAHPNLLAHLMNSGAGNNANQNKSGLNTTSGVTKPGGGNHAMPPLIGPGFPWGMAIQPPGGNGTGSSSGPLSHHSFLQQPTLKLSAVNSQGQKNNMINNCANKNSLSSSAFSSSNYPFSSSSSLQQKQQNTNSNQLPGMLHHSASTSSLNETCSSSDFSRKISPHRDDIHATTMSHLKDKLMRKYDSAENLTKIDTTPITPANTPTKMYANHSHSMKSEQHRHPLSISMLSNTAELNRELAVKLTLSSPMVQPAGLPILSSTLLSTPLSSLHNTTTTTEHSGRGKSPISIEMKDATKQVTSSLLSPNHYHNIFSVSATNTPLSSSLSPTSTQSTTTTPLLIGQGQPSIHQSISAPLQRHPMYHSTIMGQPPNPHQQHINALIHQQQHSMSAASPARSNTELSTPALAGMQRVSQFYTGSSSMPGIDKRFEMSRMDETGSTPTSIKKSSTPPNSHSPQMPA